MTPLALVHPFVRLDIFGRFPRLSAPYLSLKDGSRHIRSASIGDRPFITARSMCFPGNV